MNNTMRSLFILIGVTLLATGCGQQPATVERHIEPKESPKIILDGVWRSLESDMAFRLLPDGKADFSMADAKEVYSADFSTVNDRVRIEIATPMARTVENFLIRGDYLERESSGAAFFKEDEFLKRWLGASFADRAAIAVPTPGQRIIIRKEQRILFDPEIHNYGAACLEELQNMVSNNIVLANVKFLDRYTMADGEIYECELSSEAASLPRAKNMRRGLIGVIWGTYDIQTINSIDQSSSTQNVKIITGTYKFTPNMLGERIMARQNSDLRNEYKFKAEVHTPRTISEQPWLNNWDWGHTDEDGYKTKNIQ